MIRIILVSLVLVLTACTQAPDPDTRCPWRTVGQDPLDLRVCARVVQVERIQDYCSAGGGACYRQIGGESVIYIPTLHDDPWGRWENHQRLGHEVLHAMGYSH